MRGGGLINLIMRTDADRNDPALLDQKVHTDAVGYIDGNRTNAVELPLQFMQPKRRMIRIGFKQLQGFFVLAEELGVFAKEFPRLFFVGFGENQLSHGASV